MHKQQTSKINKISFKVQLREKRSSIFRPDVQFLNTNTYKYVYIYTHTNTTATYLSILI